jgi:hypothetical protein
MERLGDFLFTHIEGIKAVLRRERGMKDEAMLLLKLKWATAHPIRSGRDLIRFLTAQPLYSSR